MKTPQPTSDSPTVTGTGTIRSQTGYGKISIEIEYNPGMAMLAVLASLDSDGSVSVVSSPRRDHEKVRIDLAHVSQNRRRTEDP